MSRFYRAARSKLKARDSGQATVEFAFIVTLLLVLICTAIDYGRALYTMQVVAQLTRQGSSLSSRDDTCSAGAGLGEPMETLTCAAQALLAGESGLNIASYGEIIMTAVENTGTTKSPTYTVEGQYTTGGLSEASKIGSSTVGSAATLPSEFSASGTPLVGCPGGTPPCPTGSMMYVTEIYYTFSPITPIGTLAGAVLPATLYDVAYF